MLKYRQNGSLLSNFLTKNAKEDVCVENLSFCQQDVTLNCPSKLIFCFRCIFTKLLLALLVQDKNGFLSLYAVDFEESIIHAQSSRTDIRIACNLHHIPFAHFSAYRCRCCHSSILVSILTISFDYEITLTPHIL